MLLRQVQLARLMGVTSRTVRNWIDGGMPTSNGGIDPDVARRWVAERIDHHQTGWATRRPAAEPAASAAVANRSPYLQGGVAALNSARQTGAIEWLVEIAMAHGTTPAAAVGIALQLDLLLAHLTAGWAGAADGEVITQHPPPDWDWLAQLAGAQIDIKAAVAESNAAVGAWAKKRGGFTGRPKERPR